MILNIAKLTSNFHSYLFPETQSLRVSVSIIEGNLGNGFVLLGSKVKLTCEYNFDSNEKIESIAWALKKLENDFSPVASYIPGLEPPITYSNDAYQPPDYRMDVDYDDSIGQGFSNFTINAVNWTDTEELWCFVTLRNTDAERSFANVLVTGKLNSSYSNYAKLGTRRRKHCKKYW